MVERRRYRDADHQTETLWKNSEHEYDRTVFFVKYAGRSDLFEGMDVWANEKMRTLQGTYPVVFLTFAGIKETSYASAREGICRVIEEVYNKCDFLTEGDILNEKRSGFYNEVTAKMDDSTASVALRNLSDYLCRYYGKKQSLSSMSMIRRCRRRM